MKVKGTETVKGIKALLDGFKAASGKDYKVTKLYGSYQMAKGKISTEIYIFEAEKLDGSFIYWLIIDGNTLFYFRGESKEDLEKDLERFTGLTKSEKEYYINEWDMTEETWNVWNGAEEV